MRKASEGMQLEGPRCWDRVFVLTCDGAVQEYEGNIWVNFAHGVFTITMRHTPDDADDPSEGELLCIDYYGAHSVVRLECA